MKSVIIRPLTDENPGHLPPCSLTPYQPHPGISQASPLLGDSEPERSPPKKAPLTFRHFLLYIRCCSEDISAFLGIICGKLPNRRSRNEPAGSIFHSPCPLPRGPNPGHMQGVEGEASPGQPGVRPIVPQPPACRGPSPHKHLPGPVLVLPGSGPLPQNCPCSLS